MHPMNEVNTALARTRPMMNLATETGVIRNFQDDTNADIENFGKWPVWLRIVLIVGLSSALWAGIILAISTIL